MRRIKTGLATHDQVLARQILDRQGNKLYEGGTHLTVFIRTRILLEGHETIEVYEDQRDYQLNEVIRPDFQRKTMQQLRHLAQIADLEDHGPEEIRLHIIRAMVGSVVEDLFAEKNVMEKVQSMKDIHEYLYQHSVGVMITALLLGTSLGLERHELRNLGMSAVLHDMGMLFIPAHILKKKKWTQEEYRLVQNHSLLGYRFLKENTELDETVLQPVLQHQERWNGTGYPEGLSGEEISLHGQIIGLADMFDAMTTDRVYRDTYPVAEAYEFIMGDGGQLFNPKLIRAFVSNINPYPLNTLVMLSDHSIGVVKKCNASFHTRPVLSIIKGPLQGQEVDLLKQRNLVIRGTVSGNRSMKD